MCVGVCVGVWVCVGVCVCVCVSSLPHGPSHSALALSSPSSLPTYLNAVVPPTKRPHREASRWGVTTAFSAASFVAVDGGTVTSGWLSPGLEHRSTLISMLYLKYTCARARKVIASELAHPAAS